MSQQLIARSADLSRLRNEGYDVAVESGFLLVRDVPYVTPAKTVARGTLISPLEVAGDKTVKPNDHVAFFVGERPCRSDGRPLQQLIIGENQQLAPDLHADFHFSHKPTDGYRDYHHKMTAYLNILTSQAHQIDPDATATTFPLVQDEDPDSPFRYIDTATSRAQIGVINDRLKLSKIAIIGVGGTGSYILDMVAKTPVSEIHLYDGDRYLQHNAFRSPGAPSVEQLAAAPTKVDHYVRMYEQMRTGLVPHAEYVREANIHELRDMEFVFIAIDGGDAKRLIVERLVEWGINFIDVGMGVYDHESKLAGLVRTTMSTPAKRDHIERRIPFSDGDGRNEYERNIQIADLNALNAALAVIRWKKHYGFYDDLGTEHFSIFAISDNALINEDMAE